MHPQQVDPHGDTAPPFIVLEPRISHRQAQIAVEEFGPGHRSD